MIAQNTAAPVTRRMDVKLAELMPVSFSAMLQRIELLTNAIMARPVSAATPIIGIGLCDRFWVSVFVESVGLKGEQLESDPHFFVRVISAL